MYVKFLGVKFFVRDFNTTTRQRMKFPPAPGKRPLFNVSRSRDNGRTTVFLASL